VSYCGTHRANSQPFGDWEAEENRMDKGKGRLRKEFGQDAAISVEEGAIFVQSYKSRARDLDLERMEWMRAHLEIIVCKFGRNRAICVLVEAICAKSLQTDGQTDDGRRAIVLANKPEQKWLC